MPVRFPANVPYDMWPQLYGVFTALDAGLTAEAQRRWDESTRTPEGTYCQRSAGAIQKGYTDFAPASAVVVTPPCVPRALPRLQEYAADTVYAVQAAGDSTVASWSVSSGGAPCYAAVRDDPNGPNVSETYGAGATAPLVIKAGQWLVQWLAPGTPGQSGRFSM